MTGNKSILIVDDNRQLLKLIQLWLEMDGYEVFTSETGDEAAQLLETTFPPDILLTDGVMPGDMLGTDLARFAKSLYPDLPVVIMSAYLGADELPSAGGGEIDAFLPKPLGLSVLSETLRSLLTRADSATTERANYSA